MTPQPQTPTGINHLVLHVADIDEHSASHRLKRSARQPIAPAARRMLGDRCLRDSPASNGRSSVPDRQVRIVSGNRADLQRRKPARPR